MERRKTRKKRPCRICRKWFVPNARLGHRQKTCGSKECKRRWHGKKCAEWNRKNRSYFQENYFHRRLEQSETREKPAPSSQQSRASPRPQRGLFVDLRRDLVKEVIGPQHLIILEYIARHIMRSVQEVIIDKRLKPQGYQADYSSRHLKK